MPTGYKITIICTSNSSESNWGSQYYGQPYWIQFFHGSFHGYDYIGDCGGGDGNVDSEDSKVCTYVIQNSTEKNSGNYSCKSSNQMTCTYDLLYLEFKKPSPPRFQVDLPLRLNVSAGSKANLSCTASGVPRPVITWFKDGRRIPRSSVSGVKGSSLLAFETVRLSDQGNYWCEANSTEGWNRSSTVNLTVLWGPVFSIHPKSSSQYLEDGVATVTLLCEANGFPRPVIGWLKNNSRVTRGTVQTKGSISSLVVAFSEATKKPLKYRCFARNSLGNTLSKEATLTITEKNAFYIHPKSIKASLGDTVVLKCAVQTVSRPNITWLKDGKAFEDASDKTMIQENTNETSKLRIISVSEEDIGHYACLATIQNVQVSSREAKLSLKDDTVTSDIMSKIVWSSVGIGSFLIIIIVALVVFKWKRGQRRKCNYQLNKEIIKSQQEFIELQFKKSEDTINQLRNSQSSESDSTPDGAHTIPDEDQVVDNEMYLQRMAIDRNWEIPRDRLVVTAEKLGGGEFGIVNKGIYLRTDGNELPVAVKTLKDNNDQQQRLALIKELETLIRVGRHPNIVSLVGACTFEEPLCVIIEFVFGGSLDNLLRSSRVQTQRDDPSYHNIWSRLTERELLKMASDVAVGMKHLESKQCIHRDLACRNVLVGSGLVAKVADFGMARDITTHGQYIKTTEGRIPWLWMAIEALRGTCTTKGDVWSFGVVLWEIVTLGELPYKGVKGVVELHEQLQDGMRLQKPPHCSDELYNIMLRCWQKSPDDRPSFEELHVKLQEILHEETRMYINVTNIDDQQMETYREAISL
ncbi:hypothetical protein ACROYT_G037263 [Oculina patagonica]